MSRIGDLNKHQPRPFLTASCTTYRGHLDENVDDFIGVAQGDHQTLNQVRSTLHYSMDVMFCPNDVSDSTVQVEPVSLNKLDKGHASWKAKHTILGWDKNVGLSPYHILHLRQILDSIAHNQWHIGVTSK
jgi:hypothetical protein